jgi:superfamily II DNA or RNA helicase
MLPPQTIDQLILTTDEQTYLTQLPQPLEISQPLTLPDFPEIERFKQAIAQILEGNYGTPEDFLYYLAQQKPHLWQNLQLSAILDQLVDEGVLFEHQKSGAQQCQRIMKQFGVAVCADAVGLGKTRLGAAVCKLFREENGQAKIAIIAAKKLHDNWKREMAELGFRSSDYELYNKNLMSRKGNFLDDFNRYGGPDVVLIDEAHEGIRNYSSRIHKTCLNIRKKDRQDNKERYFLLLTATPWNNRRDDIYNILTPFLTRPEGFKERNFPPELIDWFNNRDIGVESFTDNTDLFRQVYKELFLQRTRKMLKSATPDLNLYAKRQAVWLPVTFESSTEQALDQIFTEFESSLYIPSADPVRYLKGSTEKRSLLGNQRRFFLQRAESSMYALKLTIKNFSRKTQLVKERLLKLEPNADGLYQFLLWHYDFEKEKELNEWDDLTQNLGDEGSWEADEFEEEEDELDSDKEERRQQLRKSIELAIEQLRNNADEAQHIYNQIIQHCDYDLTHLANIQALLETEFIQDHKREEVTKTVRELVSQGHKVLLISTFSDTVLDYYQYMTQDPIISQSGIGMAVGGSKRYYNNGSQPRKFSPHNYHKKGQNTTGIKRQNLFKLFAPEASIKNPSERPKQEQQLQVLIGSETLSVGQNLQDADYLINIDVPYNPMTLEQRIGRIDRPKQHPVDTLTIYYANSESQLLRQASRLKTLNKKLVGTITEDNRIPTITSTKDLGASVYGDTLFDDEILPDYINFLESLVKARQIEQENLQEKVYNKQEKSQKTYSQNEILYSEELAKLVRKKGFDYQPNPLTLGTGNGQFPHTITILTVDYFGPNGELISDQQEIIYWNDLTEENDGYGQAISSAFITPDFSEVVSVQTIIEQSKTLYESLILLKQQRQKQLDTPETVDNVNITSERISRIQKRIQSLSSLPEGIDVRTIRGTLKKLNQNKTKRTVQKLLKDYTDGNQSNLETSIFTKEFVNDTARLSLVDFEAIKPINIKIKIHGLLMRM